VLSSYPPLIGPVGADNWARGRLLGQRPLIGPKAVNGHEAGKGPNGR
jgi:hypothetical protein